MTLEIQVLAWVSPLDNWISNSSTCIKQTKKENPAQIRFQLFYHFIYQIKFRFSNVLYIFTFQYINIVQTKKDMSMIFLSYLPCIVKK